ncbi:MAG: helix-turn-helix domain-containing protein [Bacteroidetes bacterium]|nr:helix-turn-helix domain-containing protein [Bacteroidota bacterium]
MRLSTLFFVYFLILLSAPCLSQQKNEKENAGTIYYVKHTKEPVSVNGILSEWDSLKFISLKGNFYKGISNHVEIKVLWDSLKLYVAFKVYDKQLNALQIENKGNIWDDDCIEVYLSTNPKYAPVDFLSKNEFQYVVNVNGSFATIRGKKNIDTISNNYENRDFEWKTEALTAVSKEGTINNNKDTDNFYIVEIGIYWSSLQYTPHPGDTLLADFCNHDKDSNTLISPYLDWALLSIFAQPNKWNKIILTGNIPFDKNLAEESPKTTSSNLLHNYWWLITLLLIGASSVFYLKSKSANKKIVDEVSEKQNEEELPITVIETYNADNPKAINNRDKKSIRTTYSSKLVEQMLQILKEDFHKEISIEEVAQRLFISERQLQRIIKQEKTKTFTDLKNEIRMEKAKELLLKTDLPISSIGLEVGIQSFDHFRKLFKAYTGLTPSEYRKKT